MCNNQAARRGIWLTLTLPPCGGGGVGRMAAAGHLIISSFAFSAAFTVISFLFFFVI